MEESTSLFSNSNERTSSANIFLNRIHKMLDEDVLNVLSSAINRGYLLFLGEYQIYCIECVENIKIFTSAQHE